MKGIDALLVLAMKWDAPLQLYAYARQLLPIERSVGTCSIQHPPCHLARCAVQEDRSLINPCDCLRWMQLQAIQVADFLGPVELVFFVAVQEIVFRSPFFYSSLYGKSHRRDAYAMLAVDRIESRLIEVERRPIPQSVKRRSRCAVQPQNEESQPALSGCELGELSMKRDYGSGVERFRQPCRIPPFLVKLYCDVQCAEDFSRCLDAIDPKVEIFWKIAKVPVDVFADVGSQRRQIAGPRMSSQINIRANV